MNFQSAVIVRFSNGLVGDRKLIVWLDYGLAREAGYLGRRVADTAAPHGRIVLEDGDIGSCFDTNCEAIFVAKHDEELLLRS